jgi:hypothetical protein
VASVVERLLSKCKTLSPEFKCHISQKNLTGKELSKIKAASF